MAIKITEDGAVRYVNENNVDRTMFPNLTGAMGDEQYDALNGRLTVVEGKVSDLEECCGDVNNDITELKNYLNQKADKTDALSAYVIETETGSIASFTDGADDVPVKDLTVAIEPVQSGSGDPSPDNVRPISGWTGTNVTACGANVWDEETELGYYDASNGNKITVSGELRSANLIPILPNTTYYGSGFMTNCSYVYFDANKNYLGWSRPNGLFTTHAKAYYMGLNLGNQYGATYNNDVSVNYPSTDHDYHAYSGTTYSISWQTEAGTVYGGTLDVTTGVLTVDRAYALLNDPNKWIASPSSSTVSYQYTGTFSNRKTYDNSFTGLLCSMMPIDVSKQRYTARWLSAVDLNVGLAFDQTTPEVSLAEIKTLASNGDIAIVYDIATPQTYQLTAHEVSTILGQNNIFADCGDSTVQYRADTKLYIDKVLSQA